MRAWCGPGAGLVRLSLEVLDNGEVTDGTHVTAGQLALALTPCAQVTDLAVNTAASGNNAAAIGGGPAFAWNIARTYTLTPGRRYSFGCRYRLGTASNLVMYVSAADNDYVGVTGTFLGTPSQGVWSTARLDFCTWGPLSPGWCSSRQARWTCTECRSGPAPSRESLSQ